MKKALDRIGNLVHAKDAHKGINGYTCPCCREEVTKAEGVRQSAHFRHRVVRRGNIVIYMYKV